MKGQAETEVSSHNIPPVTIGGELCNAALRGSYSRLTHLTDRWKRGWCTGGLIFAKYCLWKPFVLQQLDVASDSHGR